jgi:hypothetical protein
MPMAIWPPSLNEQIERFAKGKPQAQNKQAQLGEPYVAGHRLKRII